MAVRVVPLLDDRIRGASGLWSTVRWGSRGGAVRASRRLANGGAREWMGSVEVLWWSCRRCGSRGTRGEVTGDDQELAAPSGTTMTMTWPCRHRHQYDSLILGPKKEN